MHTNLRLSPSKRGKLALFLLAAALVFVLAGCGGSDSDSTDTSSSTTDTPAATDTEKSDDSSESTKTSGGDADAGKSVFEANCAACHAMDGSGGVGPDLTKESDADRVHKVVAKGQGGMPAFEGKLSDEEIDNVTSYVMESLSK